MPKASKSETNIFSDRRPCSSGFMNAKFPRSALSKDNRRSSSIEKMTNYGQFVSTNNNRIRISKSLETPASQRYISRRCSLYRNNGPSIFTGSKLCEDKREPNFTSELNKLKLEIYRRNAEKDSSTVDGFTKDQLNNMSKNVNTNTKLDIDFSSRQQTPANKGSLKPWSNEVNNFVENVNLDKKTSKKETIRDFMQLCSQSKYLDTPKPEKVKGKRNIRREFVQLESCCKGLLKNSKSFNPKSYNDAYKFYALLEGLYDSLTNINGSEVHLQESESGGQPKPHSTEYPLLRQKQDAEAVQITYNSQPSLSKISKSKSKQKTIGNNELKQHLDKKGNLKKFLFTNDKHDSFQKLDIYSESDLSSLDVSSDTLNSNKLSQQKSSNSNAKVNKNNDFCNVKSHKQQQHQHHHHHHSRKRCESYNEKSAFEISKEINSSKPLIINAGKMLIAELLNLPKVDLKSKCVVGIHHNFVEEQFVIKTYRYINEGERNELVHWYMTETAIKKKCSRVVNISTGIVNSNTVKRQSPVLIVATAAAATTASTAVDCAYRAPGHQTVSSQTLANESFLFPNLCSSRISDDDEYNHLYDGEPDSLSWKTENLANDEMYFQNETDTISPIPFESSPTCLSKLQVNRADRQLYKPDALEQQQQLQSSVEELQATLGHLLTPELFVEADIPELSVWTAHGTKVRTMTVSHGQELRLPVESSRATSVRSVSAVEMAAAAAVLTPTVITAGLPPRGNKPPHMPPVAAAATAAVVEAPINTDKFARLEMNCREIRNSLEKDIPLPENLSNLYERLSKLQKMLECIPEEKITSTLEALDQLDSSDSSLSVAADSEPAVPVLLPQPTQPTSVGDCCSDGGGLLEFSTLHGGQTSSPPSAATRHRHSQQQYQPLLPIPAVTASQKGDPDSSLNNAMPVAKPTLIELDEQSEATTSLSMLENLIDDFLLKNGLTNLPSL